MAPKMLRAKSWLNAFLLIFFYYFLCLPISFSSIDAAELLDPVNETGICKSIDIRNKIGGLDELKGCKVIEGSLQILLFDNVNQTDFDNISFPELIEITDYLLLFRVNGLKSVGQLFPNLSVIRGQHLFTGGQSLIIYEMPSLQEINLYSLTRIIEGKVYIDKNPSLCFAKTIDWNKITSSNENFIRSFKTDNECPVCPAEINGLPCSRNESESSFFCWNTEHCQKTCPRCDKKKPCNDNGDCCDDRCLGGCGRDTTKCKVCAEYVLSTHEDNSLTCVKKCSGETLAFLNRRCISHDECVYMKRPTEIDLTISSSSSSSSSSKSNDYPYKVHEGSCLLECPPNYSNNNSEHSCTKCNNTCRKECKGARIDSINLAEHLKGCTHITGSIEIQIRGGKAVVKALQDNLEMIEEIDGYLKIVRSFSLVSLNFLKNLKRIRGNTLENDRNSLVILDNQNLQDLFDWKTHKEFIIDKGKLFVHFNPKLCYEKIEELRLKAQLLTPPTDTEVAKNSNGDKVACQVEPLSVTITRITSSSVSLEWDSFKIVDPRKLLSYVVYIIEAPEKNVNFYDGRDACGQDNWHVEDVPNMYDVDRVNHTLTSLKPFTQYAFFIKTYTISTEKGGAQSDINYFTTNPSKPSEPIGVTSSSSTSDSLVIRWRPPDNPNGKIKSYRIIGTRKPLRIPPNRNYCNNPIIIAETPKPTPTAPPKDPSDECKISSNKKAYDEQEETARIEFEDALHNKVYIKRTQSSPGRTKRNVDDDKMLDKHSNSSDNDYDDTVDEVNFKNITVPGMNYFEQFAYEVDLSSKSLTVEGLRHFTEYIIKVQACIEPYSANSELPCGKYAMITSHTRPKEDADTISNLSILNITFDSVTFKWTKPIDPNSDLVSVTTFYQRDDAKNPQFDCTPYQDFKNLTKNGNTVIHTISNIPPGNYSLYLKASSLHGNGPPSVSVIFKIAHNGSNTVLIVVLVLLFALVFILGGGFLFYWRYIKSTAVDRIPIKINPDYVPSIYQVDEWEVPRKNVELIKELGQGSFGMVWEGLGHDFKNFRAQKIRCAVKTVNEHSTLRERLDFLNEASVMKAFNTSHVVKLLGVVSLGQPALVVMELMVNGDLKTYLRCHRPENVDGVPPPSLKQILQMAIEIADGMAYLEGKKFVHRDLAARNCMVAENLTVKIGDFGMTRDIYETDYYRKGTRGLLPVRWMSPESLKDGVFSSSSDSWSYGVVLWEMATLASQPYQGLSNEQVLRYIMEGGIMERPENCPDKLYEVMRKCWNLKATKRPTFMQLCEILLPEASEKFSKDSFFHSDEGNEVRAIRSAANAAVAEFIADDAGDGDDADASTPLNALVPDERIVGIFNKSSLNNKGGLLTHDDNSIQSVHIDPNPVFYSMNEERSSANGYAGNGRTRNGKAQSQC